jgi:hypothetical protein
MKFLHFGKDGGLFSTVWGFWLVELKRLFSIVLLVFEPGSRDAYHDHAFDAISWVLRGELHEEHLATGRVVIHRPSWRPIITRRSTFHKVVSVGRTWVFSLRGPWTATWHEYEPRDDRFTTLAEGRNIVEIA